MLPSDSFTVPVSISTLGDNAIIAANGARRLEILGGFLKATTGAVAFTVKSSAGASLTGAILLASGEGGPIEAPIAMPAGTGVTITLSAAETVVGWLTCRWGG